MFTRGLSNLSQTSDPNSPNVNSPAEQRADSKMGFLKAMRPLPTQHYWNVYFDRYALPEYLLSTPTTPCWQPAD